MINVYALAKTFLYIMNKGSEDDVLHEIRMKYAEDLEAILECPVCYELPKGTIFMCNEGHHICSKCVLLMKGKCPTCQSSYGNCKNYVAEKLCSLFEDIKSSILNPYHASNRRALKNKVSVQVQTDSTMMCDLEKGKINSMEMKVDKSNNSKTLNTKTDSSKRKRRNCK